MDEIIDIKKLRLAKLDDIRKGVEIFLANNKTNKIEIKGIVTKILEENYFYEGDINDNIFGYMKITYPKNYKKEKVFSYIDGHDDIYVLRENDEIDKTVKNIVVRNLKFNNDEMCKRINILIVLMSHVKSNDQLMKIKNELLLTYLRYLPISAKFCVFCLNRNNCHECTYAMIHGSCGDDGSKFKKILDSYYDFLKEIKGYW